MPDKIARTGRILMAGSAQAEADGIARLLAMHGHEVHTVQIHQVLESALAQPPDLVVLDVGGQIDATPDLLGALMAQPGLQHVPIIVLSVAGSRSHLLAALDAGAMDCIGMPCAAEEVVARIHVHLRLKLTRDRLEEVARERQQLITLVAHDLKNPLTSVLFACELLGRGEMPAERTTRYLQVIEEGANEAISYIHTYLRAQAHEAHARIEPVRLDDAVRRLAVRHALQAESLGVRIVVDGPLPTACVAISAPALHQIGSNLIGNALKYAAGGGEVRLCAEPGSGCWRLLVQDRGPGVAAQFQPQLFLPYTRADAHDHAAAGSHGLGLALASQLAAAGARLWYEDRAGGGASFVLEITETTPPDQTP